MVSQGHLTRIVATSKFILSQIWHSDWLSYYWSIRDRPLVAKPKQQDGGKRLFCQCFGRISRRIRHPKRQKDYKFWPEDL